MKITFIDLRENATTKSEWKKTEEKKISFSNFYEICMR